MEENTSPQTQADVGSIIMGVVNDLEEISKRFVHSLTYLYHPGPSVTVKCYLTPRDDRPDFTWRFQITYDDGGVEIADYFIESVEKCLLRATEVVNGLLEKNSQFGDKQYIFSVGVEQVLKELNIGASIV